jgi:hypothetical protein
MQNNFELSTSNIELILFVDAPYRCRKRWLRHFDRLSDLRLSELRLSDLRLSSRGPAVREYLYHLTWATHPISVREYLYRLTRAAHPISVREYLYRLTRATRPRERVSTN